MTSRPPGPDGVAVVDKDVAWTSHDVVAKARGIVGTRKIGHSGTLDPDATGVLVLGVGKATRLLRFLQLLPKTYEAEIRFGAATSTLDASGDVVATADMSSLRPEAVVAAARTLTGDLMQVPPMVSALKVDGRRLHELAREGIEIERDARPVHVGRFEVTPTDDPMVWQAVVDCSSGTYVRSLAADLGVALGGYAHLTALRRTAVGPFTIAEARPLASIELLPLIDAVRGMDQVAVEGAVADRVRQGAVLDPEALGDPVGDGPWAVVTEGSTLLAVYERYRDGRRVKPALVIPSQ
jgi:tRNA pseudouridine55 synthase